jgi:hypothetical protein
MPSRGSRFLKQLEALKATHGGDAAVRKVELLRKLDRLRLARAGEVQSLHEILCFLRAYPDDPEVLRLVDRLLGGFERRSDLRRHRDALEDTGIAGTTIHYRFFWEMARWLARRWPEQLAIDWDELDDPSRLERFLPLLVAYYEAPALDVIDLPIRKWLDKLKGRGETDASFLIRRFDALRADSFGKETLYDDVDVPIRILPGPGTPSRTLARYKDDPVVFQAEPLLRGRPSLKDELRRPPHRVRTVSPREGRKLVDLAREAMVTRSRDLDAFAYADPRDVRLVDCGDGLQFACYGMTPERRLLFEAVYGFLTLKNGVPIGYVLSSALFGSSEIAYNVFETYRGGEAARVFGRVIAMVRHLFGSDAFAIDPYQLGHGNSEGLQSGAWWFYYKLGFRPDDPDIRRVLRGELKRMKARPRHRSSVATLEKLSSDYVYFFPGRERQDVMGRIDLGPVSLRLSRYVAERFGADREKAGRECSREAAQVLGVRPRRGFSAGERLAWERWSPLILCLPGVERWSRADKRALERVVRAKGGRRESDFVPLFDRHARLRRAILTVAAEEA